MADVLDCAGVRQEHGTGAWVPTEYAHCQKVIPCRIVEWRLPFSVSRTDERRFWSLWRS